MVKCKTNMQTKLCTCNRKLMEKWMLRPQHTNGMVNRKDGEKHYIFASVTDNNKNMEVVDKSVTCINAYDSPQSTTGYFST